MNDYPDIVPSRPIWLITLADLALLLVGFFVLLQATQHLDRKALAQGIRAGFDDDATPPLPPMPVAANGVLGFQPGSATVPGSTFALRTWAQDAARDPRVTFTVTGSVDGTPVDIDPLTRSGAILAADRARAVAAIIAAIAPGRIVIATTTRPGRRAAMVTLAFTGVSKEPS
jgi:flagellar motor protein MotB